jgi:hypothetical protein
VRPIYGGMLESEKYGTSVHPLSICLNTWCSSATTSDQNELSTWDHNILVLEKATNCDLCLICILIRSWSWPSWNLHFIRYLGMFYGFLQLPFLSKWGPLHNRESPQAILWPFLWLGSATADHNFIVLT